MEPHHTSHDLLAHFDRPKLADLPAHAPAIESPTPVDHSDTARVHRFEHSDNARVPGVERSEPPAHSNQRNTLWLLKWTAATAVLFAAAIILLEFTHLFAAEHTLTLAARAGATEATLPRATWQSVSAAIEHRLAPYPAAQGQLQLTILRNGQPVGSQLHATEGDHFSITLSVPAEATLPTWLKRIQPWQQDSTLMASASRDVPGRKLANKQRYTAAE